MIGAFIKNRQTWFFAAGVLIAVIVSLQSYLQNPKSFDGTREYPRYNNFIIFKNSFDHLRDHQNLYVLYEEEHWDLYKYSPTFSAMMAPFSALPDLPGLLLWNMVNVLFLFFALSKIQFPSFKLKLLAHVFLLPEVFTSMQNSQSNLLIAGLMILGFVYIQKSEIWKACLCILVATFIKPFALCVFVAFIFFPGKLKMVGWSTIFTVLLLLLPLLIIPFSDLIWQYENWYALLQMDHAASYGYSVQGWLNTWFGAEPSKIIILVLGLLLLLLPLLKTSMYSNPRFQLLTLASVLLWVILFNHKSESPTFIIAVSGIALWFFTKANMPRIDLILLVFAFLFTCLIATDLFPRFIRKEWAEPYVWKVVPCILVWVKINIDLWRLKPEPR